MSSGDTQSQISQQDEYFEQTTDSDILLSKVNKTKPIKKFKRYSSLKKKRASMRRSTRDQICFESQKPIMQEALLLIKSCDIN